MINVKELKVYIAQILINNLKDISIQSFTNQLFQYSFSGVLSLLPSVFVLVSLSPVLVSLENSIFYSDLSFFPSSLTLVASLKHSLQSGLYISPPPIHLMSSLSAVLKVKLAF